MTSELTRRSFLEGSAAVLKLSLLQLRCGQESATVQPGQLIIYHGWEPMNFKDWKSNQEPVPSPWKSLHMAEYGQLHYQFLFGGPHHAPRGTTVEVETV